MKARTILLFGKVLNRIFLLLLLVAPAVASAEEGLLLFSESTGESWPQINDEIEAAGGRVIQAFPPGGAIVGGESDFWSWIMKNRPEWGVHPDHVPVSLINGLPRASRFASIAWNRMLNPPDRIARPGMGGESGAAEAPRGNSGMGKVPAGGNFFDTSEFFLGSVAIAILLPESDGTIDPSTEDWDAARIDSVVAQVQEGLAWWIPAAPGSSLSFVYEIPDPVPCPYEPISRFAFFGCQETLWVRTVFDTLGYGTGDVWYRGRSYLNDVRDNLGTDWAVAVIVADSKNDADGKFSNGITGFSYYGGPYNCFTYDCGSHTISGMHAVAAHEIAHNFYALDEYYGVHSACTKSAGYEWVENQNSEYGTCLLDEACIMRDDIQQDFDSNAVCAYTRGQVGMGDDDSDGIANILDTNPGTLFDAQVDSTSDTTPTYTGTANVNPMTNLNESGEGNSITLNAIAGVQYRIDGGEWIDADPVDGVFDSTWEDFTFTTSALMETVHVFEARAFNSQGNADTLLTIDTLTIYDGTPPGVVASLSAAAFDSTVVLTWINPDDDDFEAVMIRFSTTGYPADTTEGTLVDLKTGSPSDPDTLIQEGLFPDTTYYYSFFSLDEVPNPSSAESVIATPLYPTPPAVLYAPPAGSLFVGSTIDFVWSPIIPDDPLDTLIAYELQIARDSLFTELVVDSEVTAGFPADTLWTYDVLDAGTIHWWRVRGKDMLSDTYGYWGGGSWFATELLLVDVLFLDSTVSDYTNFMDEDSLAPNTDATIEVRFDPADTLGIGGFSGWIHWTVGTPDSVPLVWNRNEGGYGYWRGDISFGDFWRGDTVSFHISGTSPNQPNMIDWKSGIDFRFTAGMHKIPVAHVPSNVEPLAGTRRSPFIPTDTDPLILFTVAASPAGNAAAGELVYHVQGDPVFSTVPLLSDTLIGGVDYLVAELDSSFLISSVVEYYFSVWGDSTWDTTFVFGDDDVSHTATIRASAETGAYWFLVQSVTGLPGADLPFLPGRSELMANRPNPFNPVTVIPFALSRSGPVSLTLYDVAGRIVRVLVDENRSPGWYSETWNGKTSDGHDVASGVYFAVIRSGDWGETRKILLIR